MDLAKRLVSAAVLVASLAGCEVHVFGSSDSDVPEGEIEVAWFLEDLGEPAFCDDYLDPLYFRLEVYDDFDNYVTEFEFPCENGFDSIFLEEGFYILDGMMVDEFGERVSSIDSNPNVSVFDGSFEQLDFDLTL